MTRQLSLPDLGEGVKEGQILRLLVREGDLVTEDQTLMEVETDKAAVEIPSPHAGVIQQLHVAERQIVNVGDLMVTFGDGAAGASPSTGSTRAAAPHGGTASPGPSVVRSPKAAAPGPRHPSRPAHPSPPNAAAAGHRKRSSPAVRKLARVKGIDLEAVDGTGPGGRVTRADIERAASGAALPAPGPAAFAAPRPITAPELPGVDGTDELGPVWREPISQARKTIASVMTLSCSTIPHVTDCNDADVTDLDRLRRGYNADVPKERGIGMLAFVIRAVARALQQHHVFNASIDERAGEITYRRYYHVAVGVQTPRGLVAPVLRDVDRMGVVQINAALAELVDRVRRGAFTVADTRGATYTISNAGAMGPTRYSTPIITPPQVAVLAVGRSRLQPWVLDGTVTARLIMPLSHSMDHRLIDGAQEMAFIQQIIGDLEQPARLLLE